MGLDNRDYLRDEQRRYSPSFAMGGGGGGFMAGAPMAKKLLIITLIAFLAQMFSMRDPGVEDAKAAMQRLTPAQQEKIRQFVGDGVVTPQMLGMTEKVSAVQEWFKLETNLVLSGQVWRLVSYAFMHSLDSPMHILFNMLWMVWIGRDYERMHGPGRMLNRMCSKPPMPPDRCRNE